MSNEIRWLDESECRVCGGRLEFVTEPESVAVGVDVVTLDVSHWKCQDCGETVQTAEEIRHIQRCAASIVREREGRLTPVQIQAIRNRLRVSQTVLEAILHIGKKSVVRWEGGQVCQGGAADSLLRVVDHFPDVVPFLAEIRGIPVPATVHLTGKPVTRRERARAADPAFGRPDVVSMMAFKAGRARLEAESVWGVAHEPIPAPRTTDTKIAV